MEEKKVILEAMKKAGEPLNAGKIAELTGLDRKVVDKAMRARLYLLSAASGSRQRSNLQRRQINGIQTLYLGREVKVTV